MTAVASVYRLKSGAMPGVSAPPIDQRRDTGRPAGGLAVVVAYPAVASVRNRDPWKTSGGDAGRAARARILSRMMS